MKYIKNTPVKGNSNYFVFYFSHRIKGKKEIIEIRSNGLTEALGKAWKHVSDEYKKATL